MWQVEEVVGTLHGTVYLLKNDRDQGYLSNNSPGGGTLHFLFRDEALDIAKVLNGSQIR